MKTYTTKSCFKNFGYRDFDIDNWLPTKMPVIPDGVISIYKTKSDETFSDMFKSNGLMDESSIIPHCFSLQSIDKLCKHNDKRLTKSYNNFFPVTDSKKVFVLGVDWYAYRWRVYVYGFDNDHEWRAGHQLFLLNLTLGNSETLSLELRVKNLEETVERIRLWKEGK